MRKHLAVLGNSISPGDIFCSFTHLGIRIWSRVKRAREHTRGGVRAEDCFSTRHGAVLTDSTPPATTKCASPLRIIRAPAAMASSPLAHWASIEVALTVAGRTDAKVATRAIFPPGPAALPANTWSTSKGEIPLRSTSSSITCASSWSAVIREYSLPARTMGCVQH